jgi:hypothetical protein
VTRKNSARPRLPVRIIRTSSPISSNCCGPDASLIFPAPCRLQFGPLQLDPQENEDGELNIGDPRFPTVLGTRAAIAHVATILRPLAYWRFQILNVNPRGERRAMRVRPGTFVVDVVLAVAVQAKPGERSVSAFSARGCRRRSTGSRSPSGARSLPFAVALFSAF